MSDRAQASVDKSPAMLLGNQLAGLETTQSALKQDLASLRAELHASLASLAVLERGALDHDQRQEPRCPGSSLGMLDTRWKALLARQLEAEDQLERFKRHVEERLTNQPALLADAPSSGGEQHGIVQETGGRTVGTRSWLVRARWFPGAVLHGVSATLRR